MTARDPLDDPELDEQYEVDGPAVDEEDVPEAPELVFASVDEWFRRYWRFSYRRRVSGKGTGTGRWSARWWENDEALQRLTTFGAAGKQRVKIPLSAPALGGSTMQTRT
jgi:hypothetical protein